MSQVTITGLGNLMKLLPSGTFFLFLYLNPLLTNNGKCNTINRYLAGVHLCVCGFCCAISWFTDGYIDRNGVTQYGIVTKKGRFADLSLFVFAIVALLDINTVQCFYPSFESTQEVLFMVLPPVAGVITSSVFVLFPNQRHGIGHPTTYPTQET